MMKRRRPFLIICLLLVAVILVLVGQFKSSSNAVVITAIIKERSIVGRSVSLPVTIETGKEAVNAIEVHLTFDPTKIKVESVSNEESVLRLWVPGQPAFSNTKGEISFVGGLPTPGFVGRGKIGSITVIPLSRGRQTVSFGPKTQALLNDGWGTAAPLVVEPITFNVYP